MIPPSAESLFEKFFVKDILRWTRRFSWPGIELWERLPAAMSPVWIC
jgi:hypothetical protein